MNYYIRKVPKKNKWRLYGKDGNKTSVISEHDSLTSAKEALGKKEGPKQKEKTPRKGRGGGVKLTQRDANQLSAQNQIIQQDALRQTIVQAQQQTRAAETRVASSDVESLLRRTQLKTLYPTAPDNVLIDAVLESEKVARDLQKKGAKAEDIIDRSQKASIDYILKNHVYAREREMLRVRGLLSAEDADMVVQASVKQTEGITNPREKQRRFEEFMVQRARRVMDLPPLSTAELEASTLNRMNGDIIPSMYFKDDVESRSKRQVVVDQRRLLSMDRTVTPKGPAFGNTGGIMDVDTESEAQRQRISALTRQLKSMRRENGSAVSEALEELKTFDDPGEREVFLNERVYSIRAQIENNDLEMGPETKTDSEPSPLGRPKESAADVPRRKQAAVERTEPVQRAVEQLAIEPAVQPVSEGAFFEAAPFSSAVAILQPPPPQARSWDTFVPNPDQRASRTERLQQNRARKAGPAAAAAAEAAEALPLALQNGGEGDELLEMRRQGEVKRRLVVPAPQVQVPDVPIGRRRRSGWLEQTEQRLAREAMTQQQPVAEMQPLVVWQDQNAPQQDFGWSQVD